MRPLDRHIRDRLNADLSEIEKLLDSDVLAILSPITPGLELNLREALDRFESPRDRLAVVIETPGGVVEVVERMVQAIRSRYKELVVLVPNRAMSAGTIFALSADRIVMDHFSCLGPIDPQVLKDGKFVPALAYLKQFERLQDKATAGLLTSADYALLSKLDLAELHQFEQARQLSIELLETWLVRYKFKDWSTTETNGTKVTEDQKRKRAVEIAEKLNDTERWHSHGRPIGIDVLRSELNLKIEDIDDTKDLARNVRSYFDLLQDYVQREQWSTFIHTREVF